MIDTQCKASREWIEKYSLIRETQVTARNVKKAMDTLKRLINIKEEIEEIETQLKGDSGQDELLSIYERIGELEEFRIETLEQVAFYV